MTRHVVLVAVLLTGCGTNPPPARNVSGGPTEQPAGDPWKAVVAALKRDNDPAAAKLALGQLSTALSNRPSADGLTLTPEAESRLGAVMPLSERERGELRSAVYGGLDPAYVADCFYLRDAAVSLDPNGVPPAKLAERAFAWVCRQVALDPGLPTPDRKRVAAALPPTAVLRRGAGSGLERAYVFLAVLQQLGIDGCLIGPPDAGGKGAVSVRPGRSPAAYPDGPFDAVGARVDGDVLLFDPWKGEPLPGRRGTDTAVFLAVPLSSLSPRMKALDDALRPETGVRLAVDPVALRDRSGKGATFWNPPGDPFAYGRTLQTFTPADEGGADDTPEGPGQLRWNYRFALVPRAVFVPPPAFEGIDPSVVTRVRELAVGSYGNAFANPPTPLEKVQRGRFQEAARGLVELQDEFQRGAERLRSDKGSTEARQWVTKANDLYAALGRADLDRDEVGLAEARAAIDQFWRNQTVAARLLVDRMTAGPGQAEAAYLLAVCKHEVAERAEAAGGAGAKAAWESARDGWQAYEARAVDGPESAARTAHAKRLADRALALAGP